MLYCNTINRIIFLIFILLQFYFVLSNKDSTHLNKRRFRFQKNLGDKTFIWKWPWDQHKEKNNDESNRDEEIANFLEAFVEESFYGNKPLAEENLKKVLDVHMQENLKKQSKDDITESRETVESQNNEVNRINETQERSTPVVVSDGTENKNSPNIGTSKNIHKSKSKEIPIHKKRINNQNIQSRRQEKNKQKANSESNKNIQQNINIHNPSVSSIATNKENVKNTPNLFQFMDRKFYGDKEYVQENIKKIQESVKLNDKKWESRTPSPNNRESNIPNENKPNVTPLSNNIISKYFHKVASYLYKKLNDVLVYVLTSLL